MNNNYYPFLYADPSEEERQDRQRWNWQHGQEDAQRKKDEASLPLSLVEECIVAMQRATVERDIAERAMGNAQTNRSNLSNMSAKVMAERQAIDMLTNNASSKLSSERWMTSAQASVEEARQRLMETVVLTDEEEANTTRSKNINKLAQRNAIAKIILQRSGDRAIEVLTGSNKWGYKNIAKDVGKNVAPHIREELAKSSYYRLVEKNNLIEQANCPNKTRGQEKWIKETQHTSGSKIRKPR